MDWSRQYSIGYGPGTLFEENGFPASDGVWHVPHVTKALPVPNVIAGYIHAPQSRYIADSSRSRFIVLATAE